MFVFLLSYVFYVVFQVVPRRLRPVWVEFFCSKGGDDCGMK